MHSIELTEARVIVIEDHGRRYQLTAQRVTRAQWLKYFDGIVSMSENQAGKRVDSFDSSAARLTLVESVLIDAKGYTSDQPVTQIDGWQRLLPLSHRMGAANALTNVSRSEAADEEPLALGRECVILDAVWSAGEDGAVRKFHGLRHVFSTPTSEQQHRYARDASRSVLIGGSRAGKTRWLGPQATLAALYDELVIEAEGYTVHGEKPDRAAVIEHMDLYHKVAAASELFSPASADVKEDGE